MKKIILLASFVMLSFMFSSFIYAQTSPLVTGITIITPPTKVVYAIGDSLNLSGLIIKLTKSDNSTENVPFESFGAKGIITTKTNGAILSAGDKKVVVSLNNLKAQQAISVKPIIVTGITIITPPTKVNYTIGDLLDLSGLVVSLTKSSGKPESVAYGGSSFADKGITTSIINGTSVKITDKKVTIKTANGKKVDQIITVNINLTCVAQAVEQREIKIQSALGSGSSNAIDIALKTRQAALMNAWTKANEAERNVAIKEAWDTFNVAKKEDRDLRLKAVKAAWDTWKTSAQSCGLKLFTENSTIDLK